MKNKLLFIAFIVPLISFSQEPCENGFAGIFPCDGYDLQAHLDLAFLDASSGNDSWGWTDPDNGNEYALVGLRNGTAFIDISDPVNPVYLGKLPTQTENSTWRDIKVYADHAFIVSEAPDHGMQVFDLTRLRNVNTPPETFTVDAHYDGFGRAHNIVINEENGYAYAVGTQTFNGGPHIVDIQDPLNPEFVSGYDVNDYTHDAQVVNYTGPDADHFGKELYIGSNENEVVILDVTDKANVQFISAVSYTNIGYTHQGWLTEDHRYFLLGDETDELGFGFNTRTIIFDFTDLDNPAQLFDYTGPTEAVDHNGYVRGNNFYLANYSAGMRVIDISDIENQNIDEIGFFDTNPSDNAAGFDGAWSVYPYFASGNIVISDTERGFFLVKDPDFLTAGEFQKPDITLFPNPAKNYITLSTGNTEIASIQIYNTIGQKIIEFTDMNAPKRTIDISSLSKGMYYISVNGTMNKKFLKN
tara:strand:+ start:57724 stop:59136 length:1413 start_codon:yes stop_codon:yes gene_type:complete